MALECWFLFTAMAMGTGALVLVFWHYSKSDSNSSVQGAEHYPDLQKQDRKKLCYKKRDKNWNPDRCADEIKILQCRRSRLNFSERGCYEDNIRKEERPREDFLQKHGEEARQIISAGVLPGTVGLEGSTVNHSKKSAERRATVRSRWAFAWFYREQEE